MIFTVRNCTHEYLVIVNKTFYKVTKFSRKFEKSFGLAHKVRNH